MVEFLDGPAEGTSLSLRRAPVFLRVVIDADKTVDALDQFDDQAKPSETIYVYRRVEYTGQAFVRTRGRGGGCRREAIAKYRLNDVQPNNEVLRDNDWWREWAEGVKITEDA